jgi:hypothetical protein
MMLRLGCNGQGKIGLPPSVPAKFVHIRAVLTNHCCCTAGQFVLNPVCTLVNSTHMFLLETVERRTSKLLGCGLRALWIRWIRRAMRRLLQQTMLRQMVDKGKQMGWIPVRNSLLALRKGRTGRVALTSCESWRRKECVRLCTGTIRQWPRCETSRR